ncbi:ATP-binding protein [Zobellia laminariae]|uniref:ATP-binding protein n=1 Tax=Zobellia laminariae TaxID=248906 RepID=UPI0026F46FA8|nr:ATP-binding protein [Zobellia laminariae]WKX78580.1 ATP-binding protein [Zobellia laminariae]
MSEQDRYGEKGTGIGLATVKKVVEGLGGNISVLSQLGEGATFTFTIKSPIVLTPTMV